MPRVLRSHTPTTDRDSQEGATNDCGCEACSEDAEIPFDNILDRLTGSDPNVTDYVLEVPATISSVEQVFRVASWIKMP
jgi:hypothetical protein